MKTSAAHVCRRRRRRFLFSPCCSAPSAHDPDVFDSPSNASLAGCPPATFFWPFLRRRNKTVPVEEILADDREEAASSENATQGIPRRGLLQKLCKKKCKITTNTIAEKPAAELQLPRISHIPTKSIFRPQPPAPLSQVPNPVWTDIQTSQSNPPNTAPLPLSMTQAARQLEMVTLLLLLVIALATLFFGRVFAVLCTTCFWLSLTPLAHLTPSSPKIARMEADIDLNSPEHKKKVILMGLLERNRYSSSRITYKITNG